MEDCHLSAEGTAKLQEGVNLLLSRWSGLQIAVENEFGGRDSRQKSQQLPLDLLSWFTQAKGQLYIDDLEDFLDEFMLSLNTEIDDGSIEEISEKLMIMHEECLEGNYKSIERLKDAPQVAVSHVRQATSDSEEEEDNARLRVDDTTMEIDAPESGSNMNQKDVMAEEPSPVKAAEAEDGWTVVSTRRGGRGKRN